MTTTEWERLEAHGVLEDFGSDRAFPYRAAAMYNEQPQSVRFGAFLSWPSVYEGPILPAVNARLEVISDEERRLLRLVWIDHQSAGHGCFSNGFIVRPVQIASRLQPFAAQVCGEFYHADGGWFEPGVQPETTLRYERLVASHGLDLYDHGFPNRVAPHEAVYPLAASEQNIESFIRSHDIVLGELAPLLNDPVLRSELLILLLAENSD